MKNRYRLIYFGIFVLFTFLSISQLNAQNLTLPRVSPAAEVSQTIGLSDITVNYSRPGVKGRAIWGGLVPYNNGIPFPWRAGANENTTISFSDDVKINGHFLPAGVYGFHIIPSESDWILIFNKHNKSWGSFFYDESQDALRITVAPEKAEFQEWLEYNFEKLTNNSVDVYMRWDRIKIKYTAEYDINEIVLVSMRNELRSLPGFSWQGPMQAAQYCLNNSINYDEALQWIDISIQRNPNFNNRSVKAQLLIKKGDTEEGETMLQNAIENSTEAELNLYGYQLMNNGKLNEAIKIFKLNTERFPDEWNVYDSYAEALNKNGNKEDALKNYEIALSKAPENQKSRIEGIINNFKN